MKRIVWSIAALVIALVSAPASADWHEGKYELQNGTKKLGTQTFNLKRSDATGRMFMASACEADFSGGGPGLSVALELESDGSFAKYKTLQKRKGAKPLRGIFFLHKGKLRAIPTKGKSKAEDHELDPPDMMVLDTRILAMWSALGMRAVDKLGVQKFPYYDVGSGTMRSLSTETKGTTGVQWKGKFKELTLLEVTNGPGTWLLLADNAGRVFGGRSDGKVFQMEGMDLESALKPKETPAVPKDAVEEVPANGDNPAAPSEGEEQRKEIP